MERIFKVKLIFVYLSLLSICSGILAQVVGQNTEEAVKNYNFCVLFLDYNQDSASKGTTAQVRWHYISNKNPYKLSIGNAGVSRDYTYKGTSDLTFYNEIPKVNGEKTYEPLLRVALGKPGRKLIVIFGDGNGNYRGVAQEIGDSVLAIDSLMLLNLTKQTIAARVGEAQSRIGPMKSFNFTVSGSTKRFRLPLAMAVSKNGRIEVIEKRKMAFTQGGRKMVILFPDRRRPDEISYTTHSVVDLPPVDYYEEEFDAIEDMTEPTEEEMYEGSND